MVWVSGPTIQSTHLVTAEGLPSALRQFVPLPVRADVNVQDLIRRYGARHQFTLILLRGTYNSLPPDEGIDIHGDVVELVDRQGRRVVLLTN
jgi:hypothetical protein